MPTFDIANVIVAMLAVGTTFALVVINYAVTRTKSIEQGAKLDALQIKVESLRTEFVSKELFTMHAKSVDDRLTQVVNMLDRLSTQLASAGNHHGT